MIVLARLLNICIIVLEVIGLSIRISKRRLLIFAFYTQLSNIAALLSSVMLVAADGPLSVTMRYMANCMLTMTFLVTLFVLVPMGGGFKPLMISDNGLYHHTLCPILSMVSYIFFEQHAVIWQLPAAVTLIYGLIMMTLKGLGLFEGPYPFFKVRKQSKTATVLWMVALVVLISVISICIARIPVMRV